MSRPLALFTLAAAIISSSSCDKHSWKDTQVLHEKYGGHRKAEGTKKEHAAPAAGHEVKPEAAKH